MPTAPNIADYRDLILEAGRAEQRGDAPLAERLLRQALAHRPDDAEARFLLGTLYARHGAASHAVVELECAARLRPFHVDTHYNLAVALKTVGRSDDAIASYRRAIELHPGLADAHNNLGNLLKDAGRWEEAEAEYRRTVELRPECAEGHNNLGVLLQRTGRLDEAVACYRRALELRPDYAEALNNLGTALHERGLLGDAMDCYDRAIAADPAHVDAHKNRTAAPLRDGRVAEALEAADRAAAGPGYALARANRADVLLRQGDLERGLPEMEWRLATPAFPPRGFRQPRWEGADLAGRTLLVCAEQGHGDAIQFVRYVPMVRERGGRIVLECHEPLVRLMRSSELADEVVPLQPGGRVDVGFDAYIETMSLAAVFRTTLDTIPRRVPYLRAPQECREVWKRRLGGARGLKVGLVWAGNASHPSDRTRSIAAMEFARLREVEGAAFYSLQKGEAASQVSALAEALPIEDIGPELHDFADTAAAIECLDLVITVDTSVAHLAGALGIPVWTLISKVPDWRWMLDREDTPWYPSMRLVRQTAAGDWRSAMDRIVDNLARAVQGERSAKETPALRTARPAARPVVGFGWPVGGPTGWGVVGMSMAMELLRRADCEVAFVLPPVRHGPSEHPVARALLARALGASPEEREDRVRRSACLVPLGNHPGGSDREPGPNVRMRVGLPVLEDTALDRQDVERLAAYDRLFAPTTWCRDLLARAGLAAASVLEQGVDPALFHPGPRSGWFPGRFVIFSGGKLEYRKGQDLVVAAFREFRLRHPEALLLTVWHNPWPATLVGVDRAGHVEGLPEMEEDRRLRIGEWLAANGIPPDAALDVSPAPHVSLPYVLREADVAVFPNRCEGSTNLVAMEAMACGVPTVLSANTGHLDLADESHAYVLRSQGPVGSVPLYRGYDGWGESSVDEIVEALEQVHSDRQDASRRAERAVAFMQSRSWGRICEKLVRELFP